VKSFSLSGLTCVFLYNEKVGKKKKPVVFKVSGPIIPEALVSLGSFLEMQNLWPYPKRSDPDAL
jgi:hypothetical protein